MTQQARDGTQYDSLAYDLDTLHLGEEANNGDAASLVSDSTGRDSALGSTSIAGVEEEVKSEEVMSVTSPETPSNPIAAMLSQVLTEEKRKPDPCVEVVEDLKVKIADLGNACWVSWTLVRVH